MLRLNELIDRYGEEQGTQMAIGRDRWYFHRRGFLERGAEALINGMYRSTMYMKPEDDSHVKYIEGVFEDAKKPYQAGFILGRVLQGAAVLYVFQQVLEKF